MFCDHSGYINLQTCIAIVGHNKKIRGYDHVLNIIMSDITVHHLAASSEEEKDEWITALNEFIFTKPMISGTLPGAAGPVRAGVGGAYASNYSLPAGPLF